ncbi:MAG: sulfite exporter TauE/SafE family protein [Elainella sp. Prado103]|jgi:uncharacterized membrane protein YfcA|nr:sulfite exporter TauE/SafE family protein [Elainella sp. Prado103]
MRHGLAFAWGGLVGILGGLIGLGGAEFRLPVLVSIFGYRTLQAIMINLVVSLVTVFFSFIFRSGSIGLTNLFENWPIVLNILAGSLLGSYMGSYYATRIQAPTLNRVVVAFLVFLSFVLLGHQLIFDLTRFQLPNLLKFSLGWIAGGVIGIFSSMLGVAGGELIIPTIVLLFSVDIKLAGSLSLAISMPTIMMGLFKYSQQKRLQELRSEQGLIGFMSVGSIWGAWIGSQLLKSTPSSVLYGLLGGILLLSAWKLTQHQGVK